MPLDQIAGFGFNELAANAAFDRQKQWAKRGPSWAVQGLREAGLNPILAAGNIGSVMGGSKAPQGRGVGSGASLPDTVSKLSKLGPEKSLLEQQKATSAAAEAREIGTRKLLDSQESKTDTERDALRLKLPLLEAEAAYFMTPWGRTAAQTALHNRLAADAAPTLRKAIGTVGVGGVHAIKNIPQMIREGSGDLQPQDVKRGMKKMGKKIKKKVKKTAEDYLMEFLRFRS